jgi:hypothetical protein
VICPAELVKAFGKKKGRVYNEFREWLGVDGFDVSVFDIGNVIFCLKSYVGFMSNILNRQNAQSICWRENA